MINREVLYRSDTYAQAFRTAKPFRHLVVDEFLNADLCRRLLEDFPGFEARHALNEMGQVGGKAVRMDVRDISPAYRELDGQLQAREFLDFMSVVTGIPDLLYDPDYVGGGTHENRDGQGLDQHVDFNFHPRTRWHRRLNLIVYLNRDWESEWGGNLQLQADPWKGDASGPSISPLFNRAVIFETTERSWHGFTNIHLPDGKKKSLSRKSFAIYLYTKERPAEETAASHATVYVPEGMPSGLVQGVTLDETQTTQLQQRFERMLSQLKFLYDREKQFANQIVRLETSLAVARDAYRLPLQGYAIQPRAPCGTWPDGWVGRQFSFTCVPSKHVRGIELELWVAKDLDGDQIFNLEVAGCRWQHFVARGSRSSIRLDVKCSANSTLEINIAAERSFVPQKVGESTDARELAWKLIAISLTH